MLKQLIFGGVAVIAPILIGWLWGLLLSRERTVRYGYSFASVVGGFLSQKIGKTGGEITMKSFSTTLDDFTFGIRLWLNGKPKPTVEDLKKRTKDYIADNEQDKPQST